MTETDATPLVRQSWVAVPVPDHLVESVNAFVLNLSLAGTPFAWDLETMSAHLGRLDPSARRLASAVADSVLAGRPLTASAMAEHLGLNLHEVLGAMHVVNDVGVARPDLLWASVPSPGAPAADQVLMMADPLVDLVVAIDRTEHRS